MEGDDTTNVVFHSNETTMEFDDPYGNMSMFGDPFTHPLSSTIVIIICYSVVFLACIIGNVLVLIVIVRNRRMRTLTNLFLANLAVADLCVGIVCIFPNMLKYLFLQWFLGKAMCKLFQFVVSMNVTASMLLLEVVAVERYIAINHPLKARRLFTRKNMYFAQFAIWIVSSVYNIPVLIMYDLHIFHKEGDESSTMSYCYPSEKYVLPNNTLATYDIATFVIWYVLPLIVMTFMYTSMAHTLRKSTLPNYIVPAVSNSKHVNASLCLSAHIARQAETLRKKDLPTTLTTAALRIKNATRSERSLSSTATTLGSSPSKQCKLPTELELSRIYTPQSLASNKVQNISLNQQNSLKATNTKPRIHSADRSPLSSSNSSKDEDPFSPHRENEQLKDDVFSVTTKQDPQNANTLDPLLTTNNRGVSPIATLTVRVSANNSTSSCESTTRPTAATRSCRYRLSSQRASRRKVIRLLILVLLAFAILVLPHHLVLLLATFHPGLGFGSLTGPLCDLVMFLNSAVNPVLYSLFSQSFRRNLKGAIRCCPCHQPSTIKRKPVHRPVHRAGAIVDNRFAV